MLGGLASPAGREAHRDVALVGPAALRHVEQAADDITLPSTTAAQLGFCLLPTACAALCVRPSPGRHRFAGQRSMRHAIRHARGSVMQASAFQKGHMTGGTANHFAAE